MRLVLSGYYGFRNSGDEAVLQSILTALAQAGRELGVTVTPVVLSGDPAWTSLRYGVEAVSRMKLAEVWAALRGSAGLISGGGSLLQDATGIGSIPYYLGIMEMARWCGKPTFVYAQGIGPVNRALFRAPIARAFRKAAYVSVRDETSAALLKQFGVSETHVDVVPDPVMGLSMPEAHVDAAAANADGSPVVGVSVRYWRTDRADLDRVAAALSTLAERRNVRLRFLPLHQGTDEDASRYVMEQLRGVACELAPAYEEPREMLREVSGCRLLLGMRLHSLIYAANREVPLLGISYDPKIDQFLDQLDQRPVGSTEGIDAGRLTDRAIEMLDDPTAWLASVRPAIERMKQNALRPAQQILSHLRM